MSAHPRGRALMILPPTGPGVSEFFGDAITSYDWAYMIAPDRTGTLLTLLGDRAGDDVLDRGPPTTTSMAAR
jgi:hypothetical protein